MASRSSIASAHRPVRPIWVALVFLTWAAYNAASFFYARDYFQYHKIFAYERLIAASTLAAGKADEIPDRLSALIGTRDGEFIEEIDRFCKVGMEHGELPAEAIPEWALAHFLIGSRERARELIALPLASQVDANAANELAMVQDYITGREPDANQFALARQAWEDGTAGWPVYHILASRDDEDGRYVAAWLDNIAERIISEGTAASSLMLTVKYLGLLCLIVAFASRREFPPPLPNFRLPRRWPLSAIVWLLFASLLLSDLIFRTVSYGLSALGRYDLGMFVGMILFTVLPAIWFTRRFTPGWLAARRLFGVAVAEPRVAYPAGWIFLLALGTAGASLLLDEMVVEGLALDVAYRHPEDWIAANFLDRPASRILGLLIGVIAAPLCEEWVFRGFLFGALRTRISAIVAALLSSAVFATIHWYSAFGWTSVFLSGLLFCWLYHRTHSLWPGIFCHGIYNLVVIYYAQAWYSF